MTTKLSPAQQEIVDAMRWGAEIIVGQHMDGYAIFELVQPTGALIYRITERTFDALEAKGVIVPTKRKGHYKLSKEYMY